MPVTLLTLLKVAPMKEETRQKFLAQFKELTPAQKERLSQACWTTLSQTYFAKLKYEKDKLMLEIQQGKKKFNKKDFDDIQQKVSQEFVEKLKAASTAESVEDIREELQKQLRKTEN